MKTRAVEREMAGRVHADGAAEWEWGGVTVWARWREGDPLAVELTFVNAVMASRWSVARDVLLEGLERSAGAGEFIAGPYAPPSGPPRAGRMGMILRNWRSGESTTVSVVTSSMRKLLEATFAVVADGQEYAPGSAAAMAFDAELLDTDAWAGGVEGL